MKGLHDQLNLTRNLSLDLVFFKTYEPPLYGVFMPREVSLLLNCAPTNLRLRLGQFNRAKVPDLGRCKLQILGSYEIYVKVPII